MEDGFLQGQSHRGLMSGTLNLSYPIELRGSSHAQLL